MLEIWSLTPTLTKGNEEVNVVVSVGLHQAWFSNNSLIVGFTKIKPKFVQNLKHSSVL